MRDAHSHGGGGVRRLVSVSAPLKSSRARVGATEQPPVMAPRAPTGAPSAVRTAALRRVLSPRVAWRRGAWARGAVLALLVAGCRDQPEPTPVADRPVESAPTDTVVEMLPTGEPSTYDPDLGPVLLVPLLTDGNGGAFVSVLSPLQPGDAAIDDTVGLAARVGTGRVALFARRGLVAERLLDLSQLQAGGPAGCPTWPVAALRVDTVAEPGPVDLLGARGWLVGVPTGKATGVPLDSIEAMPARDSAMLAANLTRLASGLGDDTTSVFQGLPFAVRRAWRTRDLSEPLVLAVLVRRIPQEDRPLEERTTLVVTASGDPRSWRIAWVDRMSGREEEVIATEPLAVLQTGSPVHLDILLGRDDGSGTALALLQREGARWRVRWESPVGGC